MKVEALKNIIIKKLNNFRVKYNFLYNLFEWATNMSPWISIYIYHPMSTLSSLTCAGFIASIKNAISFLRAISNNCMALCVLY